MRYYALYQREFSVIPRPLSADSHVFVDYTSAPGVEEVFAQFQAEAMTETRYSRIVVTNVKRTSMSVGDVVLDEDGHAFTVMPIGFEEAELTSPVARTELALHLLSLGLETTVGWTRLFEHDPALLATAIVERLRGDPYGVGRNALKPLGIPPALEGAA